ncbi:hypothetical protein XpiCFBP4643_10865 [Xanthomonas pisi]|uniref:Uncharacterized protein n=1 Tax=Xanthomonas pisi TaxID=56457 RepID=A0A2S7D321_9XANT|nr:hypothetical protein XpiCFBP4643_10865 [Xanthomonas pisi]
MGRFVRTLTPTPAPRPSPRLRRGRSKARAPVTRKPCLLAQAERSFGSRTDRQRVVDGSPARVAAPGTGLRFGCASARSPTLPISPTIALPAGAARR